MQSAQMPALTNGRSWLGWSQISDSLNIGCIYTHFWIRVSTSLRIWGIHILKAKPWKSALLGAVHPGQEGLVRSSAFSAPVWVPLAPLPHGALDTSTVYSLVPSQWFHVFTFAFHGKIQCKSYHPNLFLINFYWSEVALPILTFLSKSISFYVAAPGLHCGTWHPLSSWWHARSLVAVCGT